MELEISDDNDRTSVSTAVQSSESKKSTHIPPAEDHTVASGALDGMILCARCKGSVFIRNAKLIGGEYYGKVCARKINVPVGRRFRR